MARSDNLKKKRVKVKSLTPSELMARLDLRREVWDISYDPEYRTKYKGRQEKSGQNTGLADKVRAIDPASIMDMSQEELWALAKIVQKVANSNYTRVVNKYGLKYGAKRYYEGAKEIHDKKVEELTKEGKYDPKKDTRMKDGVFDPRIKLKGLNDPSKRNELISEISRGLRFMRYQTSTLKGIRSVEMDMGSRVKGYRNWDEDTKRRFWDLYESFKESDPARFHELSSDSAQMLMRDVYVRGMQFGENDGTIMKMMEKLSDDAIGKIEIDPKRLRSWKDIF